MTLNEPWVIAADRHRSGKATSVLNMFKTVVSLYHTVMTVATIAV